MGLLGSLNHRDSHPSGTMPSCLTALEMTLAFRMCTLGNENDPLSVAYKTIGITSTYTIF
jgi:hypothetical protein